MHPSGQPAFVLPYALMLGSALLALGVLFLRQGEHQLARMEGEALRTQATTALRLNVQPLIQGLEKQLKHRPASALVPANPGVMGLYRSILIDAESGNRLSLCSTGSQQSGKIHFTSSGKDLEADVLVLSAENASQLAIAWAMEDLSLHPGSEAPPTFWPLPDYFYSPHQPETSNQLTRQLDRATHGQWREGPWVPAGETLPLQMDSSPSLVPVVEKLRLRMGIFATGPVRSREKIIRARFYLEGCLWNPYNRTLQAHYGSGLRSFFQMILYNLPEVRIHNENRGVSTNWIQLDYAENDYSGKYGFHGWIRLPADLEPGERFSFSEPDPDWQPEGLARTLHPAFPVGPADRIVVEIRQPPGGVYAACLPLEDSDPLASAIDGAGWFRLEGFPVDGLRLEFDRADDGERPFYLPGGSLSFRRENAHLLLSMNWLPEPLSGTVDPRRRSLNYHDGRAHPEGGWARDRDLVTANLAQLSGNIQETMAFPNRAPLFSWPEEEPRSLIEASDLPQWTSGFRIGSPKTMELNKLLDESWAWDFKNPGQSVHVLLDSEGNNHSYRKMIPVNTLSQEKWTGVLNDSAGTFPAYPWINPEKPTDLRLWTPLDIRLSVKSMTTEISQNPSNSVSDFFNRGHLVYNMNPNVPEDPLHPLMPLRGWLRNTPMLRAHGSAWLLHLAVRVAQDENFLWRSARLWLLETGTGVDAQLEVIQFAWTDPENHLEFLQIM